MSKIQQNTKRIKTKLLVSIMACASLLMLSSPFATAQEKSRPKAKPELESNLGSENKPVTAEQKKAAAQAHAEALQHSRNGEYAKAVALLAPYTKQPLAFVPLTGDYLVFIIWSGDNLQATNEFEKLPANFPRSNYLLRNMAKAYYDQNSFESAAKLYADTVKNDPKDDEAQKGHVLSLYHSGKAEEAAAKLNEYMKVNPNSTTLQYLKPQILQ